MGQPTKGEVRIDNAVTVHRPYVADEAVMPELTWQSLLLGTILGIVFGASSLYLVLKVGMTVSASIPVAVLSITLFRGISKAFRIRRATILENNIVQTTGSAGESVAFGVGVTMPALMLLGYEMDVGRVMVVSVLGGLLGILMMIPLRRAFIVKKHGQLKYPEGTACADVLIVGERGGASAKLVFVGFGIAFVYQFLMQGMRLWRDVASRPLGWFKGAVPAIEVNPALLGVGYIIGTRVSCIMVAGGVLSSFLLIPAIYFFGSSAIEPLYPATVPIAEMDEDEVWGAYVLYIGAGAVAAGGIISLFQAVPLIFQSLATAVRDMRGGHDDAIDGATIPRTDRDLPIWIVGAGSVVLIGAIWATSYLHPVVSWIPDLNIGWQAAVLILLFGFLFVTVSSRLTGEIGSSSNPISGMTVAALLLTCLFFLAAGMNNSADRLAALSIAAVVCVAASNGGTTSQDLKTGFLVGATPKAQQIAILVGALTSSLVIGLILVALNEASTIYSQQELPRPEIPVVVDASMARQRAPEDETLYYVWHAVEGNPQRVPQGKYLLNDSGEISYLVDPGINGTRIRRDDGSEVQRFSAPKARLMALVTDGILNQKLPWALVLLGVSISIVLELCKVPSLPFAVGVYLPLSASAPIFVGGLVRFVVDKLGPKESGVGEPQESDMTSGVLLSTGYIAGGAIAGVLVAFLSFSEEIPAALARWEHSTQILPNSTSLQDASVMIAREKLGIEPDAADRGEENAAIESFAKQIYELNNHLQTGLAPIAANTTLELPGGRQVHIEGETTAGDVARIELGSPGKAGLLLELNQSIEPAVELPAGTQLRLPQRVWPAVTAFTVVTTFLLLVGLGLLLKTPTLPVQIQDGVTQVGTAADRFPAGGNF